MSASLSTIASFVDGLLRLSEIPDEQNAVNGLQLEVSRDAPIETLACAVDADAFTIEEAIKRGAQLLLVHHGLFWSGNRPLVGPYGRKIQRCFTSGLSIYSAHAPLDVHPEVGNNAQILKALGLTPSGTFGKYLGVEIGLATQCDLGADELRQRIEQAIGPVKQLGKGPERIRRLAVCSGGAGSMVSGAARAGFDAYLTGEGAHYTALDAEERGIHMFLAGHYRTEVFGVKALAKVLADKFALKTFFIEHDTGL